MGKLDGKVAIVTGAARGIGAAIARKLCAEGAKVVMTDVLDELGRAEAQRIGANARYRHHDVSRNGDWSEVVAETERVFGPVDVLVNNAGIQGPVAMIEAIAEADFDLTIAVNLKSVFFGMKAVLPGMKARKSGSIVNISSIAAMISAPRISAYTATKGAVRSITKAAATEGAPFGVRVNSVHPGYTNTDIINLTVPPEQKEEVARMVNPLGRMAQPAEIANMVAFLASDEAAFATGGEFVVDGGQLVQ